VDSAAKRGELPMHDRIAELRVRELHIAAEQDFDVADLELDHTPPGTARGAGTDSSLNSSGEGTRAWPPISLRTMDRRAVALMRESLELLLRRSMTKSLSWDTPLAA
jgi:hypothetical protein